MTKKLLLLFSLLLLVVACQPQAPEEETEAIDPDLARQGIEARNQELLTAFNNQDYEAMLAFYTDDAISLSPGQEMVVGKEALRQNSEQMQQAEGMPDFGNLQLNTTDVEVAGDLAVEVGTYSIDMTTPDGNTMTDHGKYLSVWKNVDGTWMLHREIYNSNTQPPMPGGEQPADAE